MQNNHQTLKYSPTTKLTTKKRIQRAITFSILSGGMVLSSQAEATFGYFSHGYGTRTKAMAGAGLALPLDAVAGATNPANVAFLSERLEIGAALFSPRREFDANNEAGVNSPVAPGRFESGREYFVIPSYGQIWEWDESNHIGVSLVGNGGLNTDYGEAVFARFGAGQPAANQATNPTGVDLVQATLGLTWAHKLNERHAIGITPILAVQAFEAEGLQPFKAFSESPDNVTNKGRDWSYGGGLRLGWTGKMTDDFSLAASYQSRLYMSKFDKYKGLFAEQGDFDIPANWSFGIAFKPTSTVRFALDYLRIEYGSIDSIANPNNVALSPGALGSNNGLGFGWRDQTIVKFGFEWDYDPALTLRGGFGTASQVIPDDQVFFNVLATAVIRDHFTAGFTYKLDKDNEINMAAMYAPRETVSGTNINTGPQSFDVSMRQYELELSWTMKFD